MRVSEAIAFLEIIKKDYADHKGFEDIYQLLLLVPANDKNRGLTITELAPLMHLVFTLIALNEEKEALVSLSDQMVRPFVEDQLSIEHPLTRRFFSWMATENILNEKNLLAVMPYYPAITFSILQCMHLREKIEAMQMLDPDSEDYLLRRRDLAQGTLNQLVRQYRSANHPNPRSFASIYNSETLSFSASEYGDTFKARVLSIACTTKIRAFARICIAKHQDDKIAASKTFFQGMLSEKSSTDLVMDAPTTKIAAQAAAMPQADDATDNQPKLAATHASLFSHPSAVAPNFMENTNDGSLIRIALDEIVSSKHSHEENMRLFSNIYQLIAISKKPMELIAFIVTHIKTREMDVNNFLYESLKGIMNMNGNQQELDKFLSGTKSFSEKLTIDQIAQDILRATQNSASPPRFYIAGKF